MSPTNQPHKSWLSILQAMDGPQRFFALAILIVNSVLGALLFNAHGAQFFALLTAFVALIFALIYFVFALARRDGKPQSSNGDLETATSVKTFNLEQEVEREEFYEEVTKVVASATQEIYRSGRGFTEGLMEPKHEKIVAAEREALRKGVRLHRIQTSRDVSDDWASAYAGLLEEYPEKFCFYLNLTDPPMVNIAVIDPLSASPVVQFLFEPERSGDLVGTSGVIIRSDTALSKSVVSAFKSELDRLYPATKQDILSLGNRSLYFAYGSNMSSKQIIFRCPQAEVRGLAVLYGWRFQFGVWAAHRESAAAGIYREDGALTWGVVYSLNDKDASTVASIEAPGYERAEVDINYQDSRAHTRVFTFVPSNKTPDQRALDVGPNEEYLAILKEAAIEYDSEDLGRLG